MTYQPSIFNLDDTIREIKSKLIELKRCRNVLLFEGLDTIQIKQEINTFQCILDDIYSSPEILKFSANSTNKTDDSSRTINNHVPHNQNDQTDCTAPSVPHKAVQVVRRCESSSSSSTASSSTSPRTKSMESYSSNESSRILIYCSHFVDGSDSEHCGFHWVLPIKQKRRAQRQCRHHCRGITVKQKERENFITRTRNKTFSKCKLCSGQNACIRDATKQEEEALQQVHNERSPGAGGNTCKMTVLQLKNGGKEQNEHYQNKENRSKAFGNRVQTECAVPSKHKGGNVLNANKRKRDGKEWNKNDKSKVEVMNVDESDDEETESESSSSSEEEEEKKQMTGAEIRALSFDERIALAMYLVGEWNEDEDWCRYCGSRWAKTYCASPWGSWMLCRRHYSLWHHKKTLDLSKWKEEPTKPLHPEENRDEENLVRIIQRKLSSGIHPPLPC